MSVRHPPALWLWTLLAACCTLPVAASALAQEAANPSLGDPVTGGIHGQPFGQALDLPPHYVEEERFFWGTAVSYQKAGTWTMDGRWDAVLDERAPYAVRMLVRRPIDALDFNGILIVEWLNVTALREGAADYGQMQEELLREGYAWVGVGAQEAGVHAPETGLKDWDSERYRPLNHPGDRFSYDIFSQAARLIRDQGRPGHPLEGLTVRHVIATGRSQSAFRLVTYVNAVDPRTRLFDGYFVHSRGQNASGIRADRMAQDAEDPIPPGARIRTDIEVPVFDLQAEGDMTVLRSHLTRQEPSNVYRRWEIAGAAHTEVPLWIVEEPPPLSTGPGCTVPVNAVPHHAVVKAGLRALVEWVRDGVIPQQSPEIELGDPAAPDPVLRDEFGNARGGIRLPHLEVPTATLDGVQNTVAEVFPGMRQSCNLFGRTMPFEEATLRRLYPTHEAFVGPYLATVDALEREGYILAPEAEEARRAARGARIGRR